MEETLKTQKSTAKNARLRKFATALARELESQVFAIQLSLDMHRLWFGEWISPSINPWLKQKIKK